MKKIQNYVCLCLCMCEEGTVKDDTIKRNENTFKTLH